MSQSDRGRCYIDPAVSRGSRCRLEGQSFFPPAFGHVRVFLGASCHLLQTEKAVTAFLQVRFLFKADGSAVRPRQSL